MENFYFCVVTLLIEISEIENPCQQITIAFQKVQLHMLRDIKFLRGFSFKITAKKMKFSIHDFFSKCKQICGKLRI